MSLAALIALYKANEGLILTILFLISEALGANPKIKSNGILSFILVQLQAKMKDRGAVDPTP